MSIQNKIRAQVGLFSLFVSSLLLVTLTLFGFELKLINFLFYNFLFTTLIYLSLSFFVKYFLNRRIKEVSDQLFSKDVNLNKTVTTNMDELIDEIKQLDDKRKIELSEMREKESFRREFIGNLAHELKTPLFTSQSYILTLLDGAIDDKVINKKYLKIAGKSIERLSLIVKDLDLITKLETGDNNLKKSNFDIVDLLQNSIEMLDINAKKKNIKLILEHENNPPLNVNAAPIKSPRVGIQQG